MLPVVDRPLIQHVVDEARQAGIEHFIFVTGRNKGVIEDHFDRQFELELTLTRAQADAPNWNCWRATCPAPGRRASPASNCRSASATRCGAPAKSSAMSRSRCCLPDVLVQAEPGCLAQMIDAYAGSSTDGQCDRRRGSAAERVHMYGVVGVGKPQGDAVRDHPHGRKAAAGGGALEPDHHRPLHPAAGDLRACWQSQSRGAGGEIQLTDAMIRLARTAAVLRIEIRGSQLRLRQQDRLPCRQCRLCAGSRRYRAGAARRNQDAARVTPQSTYRERLGRYSSGKTVGDEARHVNRLAPGAVLDLMAAGGAVGDDDGVGARLCAPPEAATVRPWPATRRWCRRR